MFEPFLPHVTEVSIPSKCEGCGVQCETAKKLTSLVLKKQLAEIAGEGLVGEDGEEFDAMVDASVPEEIAGDIKVELRKSVGDSIEQIDTAIEETEHDIDANALACDGVLKMRASKGDVTYTVNVCTSPRVYSRDNPIPNHLPAHIRATSRLVQE